MYKELKEKTDHLIKNYRADLWKHDRRELKNNPFVPFLHFTRESGTHLIFMPGADTYPAGRVPYLFGTADRYDILEQKRTILDCSTLKHSSLKIVYYDGRGANWSRQNINGCAMLKEVSYRKAVAIMEKYVSEINAAWRKKAA